MIRTILFGVCGILALNQVSAQQTAPGDEVLEPPVDASMVEEQAPAIPPVAGRVARSAITTGVVDREPVDSIITLANTETKVFYFTDLRHFEGQTVKHLWEYEGQTMSEVSFEVKGARWRVWSSKTMNPKWIGDWRVYVIDGSGEVVGQNNFTYTERATKAIQ